MSAAAGWYHAALLVVLPWVAATRPQWAPAVAAAVLVGHLLGARSSRTDPWPWCVVVASSLLFLAGFGTWSTGLGWLILAFVTAGLEWWGVTGGGRWRHTSGLVATVGWAVAFATAPDLLATSNGGWIAPATLLFATRRLVSSVVGRRSGRGSFLQPPSREVRGTLSLRSVVVAGADGLPHTVPMDLELRAGQSLAVLCNSPREGWILAQTLSGRTKPVAGDVAVDGSSLRSGDLLVAVVAPGEAFLEGDLELNLAALCDEFPDRETVAATIEACGLDEAIDTLGDNGMAADGAPLSAIHRLQVAAARVIPSSYRMMVVVDPALWVNPVHGEIWRSTVVRASLGRTAVWFTADRELAGRADRVLAFRSGGLREMGPDRSHGSREDAAGG